MNNTLKLSKKEAVVVFMALFFLLMNLGAVSHKSHVHAKRMICKSNLEQCYRAMIAFTNDNDGYFPDADYNDDGISDPSGQWWFLSMRPYYVEQPDIFICPVANRKQDENSTEAWVASGRYFPVAPDECWGRQITVSSHPDVGEWVWSSYGPNGWLMDPGDETWGAPTDTSWWAKPANITTPSAVPLILDSRHVDAWPHHTDTPPSQEFGYDGYGAMQVFLLNRHGNGISMAVFADGSARAVGLKEMWTLKWHKTFDTDNSYTQPSTPWPAWMQGFQDY